MGKNNLRQSPETQATANFYFMSLMDAMINDISLKAMGETYNRYGVYPNVETVRLYLKQEKETS